MKKPLRTSLLMLCLATPLAALAAGVDEAAIRATEQAGGEWLSHGRTYADIARAMGLSQSAVEKHMMRALEACKASIAAEPAVPRKPGNAPR